MADSKKLDWAGNDSPRSDEIDWGGQAFPTEGGDQSGLYPDPGMSLRDYMAIHASDEDMRHVEDGTWGDRGFEKLTRAQRRYLFADAMIAARKGGA